MRSHCSLYRLLNGVRNHRSTARRGPSDFKRHVFGGASHSGPSSQVKPRSRKWQDWRYYETLCSLFAYLLQWTYLNCIVGCKISPRWRILERHSIPQLSKSDTPIPQGIWNHAKPIWCLWIGHNIGLQKLWGILLSSTCPQLFQCAVLFASFVDCGLLYLKLPASHQQAPLKQT